MFVWHCSLHGIRESSLEKRTAGKVLLCSVFSGVDLWSKGRMDLVCVCVCV